MNFPKENPHDLDAGLRKLASWAQVNATTTDNVLLLIVLLAVMVVAGVER